MALKTYKPTTPSRRGQVDVDHSAKIVLPKKKAPKRLLKAKISKAGRKKGTITIRHRGGGHKRKLRVIDFKRTDKLNIPGKVASVEYDPNRSAYISLINYTDGEKRYILTPQKMKVGFTVLCSDKATIQPGNRLPIRNIPEGIEVYNVEMHIGKGGQLVRSAGSSAKIVSLEGKHAQIKLPSGEVRLISKDCYATIGVVSNSDHSNRKIGKAGRARWMGLRPEVRGSVMNPNDHPHGGGEGCQPIGLPGPKTPWGKPALGFKTRRRKATDRWILKRRPKKKKRR